MGYYGHRSVTANDKDADFFLELGDMVANKLKQVTFENKETEYDNNPDFISGLYSDWRISAKDKELLILEILAIILSKEKKRSVLIPNRMSVSGNSFYHFRRTTWKMGIDDVKKNLTEFANELPPETLNDVEYLLSQYTEEINKEMVTTIKLDKTYNFYEVGNDTMSGEVISFDTLVIRNHSSEVLLKEVAEQTLSTTFQYNQLKDKFRKEFEMLKANHIKRMLDGIKDNKKICEDLKEKYAEHFAFKKLAESVR